MEKIKLIDVATFIFVALACGLVGNLIGMFIVSILKAFGSVQISSLF